MAVSVGIRTTGLKEAQAFMAKIESGASTWQRTRVGAGSNSPYAFWISEGHYFGGRPGTTRATHFMQRAIDVVLPTVGPRIAKALPLGGAAVSAEASKISQDIAVLGQGYVTVKSGNLRGTIRSNRGQGLRGMG